MAEIKSTRHPARYGRSCTGAASLEVETPVLQPVHGGANRAPFSPTHINAYDMEHLPADRAGAAPQAAGWSAASRRSSEIGRIFRNEGVDSTHNPEFTMLEAYEAYGDYDTIGTLTRELIQAAAVGGARLHGFCTVPTALSSTSAGNGS